MGSAKGDDRILATVLFTDIVDSTKTAAEMGDAAWRRLLDDHDRLVRRVIAEHGGTEIKSTGDGFLAMFERPAQGIGCALACARGMLALGIQLRAGLHTGEIERRGDDIGGIAVHVAARIAAEAGGSEVLASSTVRDLAAGAGFKFVSRGATALKGVKGRWRLFVVDEAQQASRKRVASPAAKKSPAKSRVKSQGLSALIVDDHPLWRQTIASLLTSNGLVRSVVEAGDGDAAVALAREKQPDVIIMDMSIPKRHGIDATKAIVGERPGARVLILSSSDEPDQVLSAIRAGALGYMLKTADTHDIVDAVRRVHAGEAVVPAALTTVVFGGLRSGAAHLATRVVIAASAVLEREGLAHLVSSAGCEVVARIAGPDALEEGAVGADVLVVETPDVDSWVQVVGRIRATRSFGMLVLSHRVDPIAVGTLLSLGSEGIGYVLKGSVADVSDLATAVRRIAAGEAVLDPEIVRGAVRPKDADPIGDLTERERDVLRLIAEGHSNQSIAEHLFLSPKRVEGLVGSVFAKLGLQDAPESNRRVLAAVTWLRSSS